MRNRVVAVIGFVLVFAVAALAHGDKKHVMGTVEKVNSDSIAVKTNEGKIVEVKLAPSTVYVTREGNQDKPAKASDLAVGDRVVIHATSSGETLTADQVKFSHGAHSAAAGGKSKP